jgi:transcriptional regulator with XRE-family HTH domain
MDLKKQIAIRVRTIRKVRGLSQDDLAALIDRSVDAISNIERAKNLPGLETLYILATKLDLPLTTLLGISPSRGKTSAKRVALLMELSEIGRQLSDDQLSIAVRQLRALLGDK